MSTPATPATFGEVEKKTAALYSSCFAELNEWKEDAWLRQGEMYIQNLGLKDEMIKDKKCMDGGCGHGTLSYQLLQHGAAEVWGVDLHHTLRKGKFENNPKMHFLQASLLDLPIADNTFDLVASNGVLHHTADGLKGFKEFVRVAKPGGKVVIGVYAKHGLFPYCLWLLRLFTVKMPIIPESFMRRVIKLFRFSPMISYQILDYAYVPCLARYSPKQIQKQFYEANGMTDIKRIFGLTPEQAKFYREHKTVYGYDTTTLSSKILFGYGFLVFQGTKK